MTNSKIFCLLLLLSSFLFAQQEDQSLQAKLDNLLSTSFFESTMASLEVHDLSANKLLYQKNNRLLLNPASNMKILTSAAALLFLKDDYQFKTRMSCTGTKSNEILYGDLYVTGGFDPLFSTDDLDSLIKALSSAGIKEITGNLYGDVSAMDSLYWGNGWMWDDDPSTDAPYLSPLNINNNTVIIRAQATKAGNLPQVNIIPSNEYFPLVNEALTTDTGSSTIYIDRDWINRSNAIIVKGAILKGEEKVTELNVYKPELYFLNLFKDKLNKAGIKISGKVSITDAPLYVNDLYTFNRGLDTVLIYLNKTSDNLSAEMIIRALAAKYYPVPSTAANGLKLIDSLISLAGFDPVEFNLADGSGVSRYNLVSARLITEILKYFYYNYPELFKKLYNTFPIAGIDGTLQSRMKGASAFNNVHAKTGTLSGVSCLSGYLTAANGHLLAFSIFMQNHVNSNKIATGYQNEICRILAEYK